MSKISLRTLILFPLVLAMTAPCAVKAITADELARHLGVDTWETTIDNASSLNISLARISNGKIVQTTLPLLGSVDGKGMPIDPGHSLVIMLSMVDGKPKASLQLGQNTNYYGKDDLDLAPSLSAIIGLPDKVKAGDYVLGYTSLKKNPAVPLRIEDIENGLMLRIKPIVRN